MKKEIHEPAKVVGNVDLKKGQEKANSSIGFLDIQDEELQMSFKPVPQGPLPSDAPDVDTPAGLMAEKPGAKTIGEKPDSPAKEDEFRSAGTDTALPVVKDGAVSPGPHLTLDEKAYLIRDTVIVTVAKVSDRVGKILELTEFGGDSKKALSKDPYKGTSLNALANHPDQPLSRQSLADCLRGHAVGTEMEELGLKRKSIDFYKRVEISRLTNQDARVKLILLAEAKKLTVKEIREEVKRQTRKVVSTDSDLSQTVLKQLVGSRLTEDQDTREFLHDKDRLKAALSRGETAKLLGESEKFRKKSAENQAFLQRFEELLEEIFVEKRLKEVQPEKAASADIT